MWLSLAEVRFTTDRFLARVIASGVNMVLVHAFMTSLIITKRIIATFVPQCYDVPPTGTSNLVSICLGVIAILKQMSQVLASVVLAREQLSGPSREWLRVRRQAKIRVGGDRAGERNGKLSRPPSLA